MYTCSSVPSVHMGWWAGRNKTHFLVPTKQVPYSTYLVFNPLALSVPILRRSNPGFLPVR